MNPVTSTTLARYLYDAAAARLYLEFVSGKVYCYEDVPQGSVDAFEQAASKGQHFNRAIKGKFKSSQVDPAKVPVLVKAAAQPKPSRKRKAAAAQAAPRVVTWRTILDEVELEDYLA